MFHGLTGVPARCVLGGNITRAFNWACWCMGAYKTNGTNIQQPLQGMINCCNPHTAYKGELRRAMLFFMDRAITHACDPRYELHNVCMDRYTLCSSCLLAWQNTAAHHGVHRRSGQARCCKSDQWSSYYSSPAEMSGTGTNRPRTSYSRTTEGPFRCASSC